MKNSKKAILLVSYGTSHSDSRTKALGAIEAAVKEEFDDYKITSAFSSRLIIDIIKKKTGEEVSDVKQAIDKLISDGVKTLILQPTYIVGGNEYEELTKTALSYRDRFDDISVGKPLLYDEEDHSRLADALIFETKKYSNEVAVVFMGHGAEHKANAAYSKLQDTFSAKGRTNYFVGTVKAVPTLEDTVSAVKSRGFKKAVLLPLMVTAGIHVKNDMAGDKEGSWKRAFEDAGIEVECTVRGLGEIKSVRDIYAAHIAHSQKAVMI